MTGHDHLGSLEEVVLLAMLELGDEAYGVAIARVLERIGRPTTIGALYTTCERLEDKGLVRSREGAPTAERGGRRKRFFTVTGKGITALKVAAHTRGCINLPRGLALPMAI